MTGNPSSPISRFSLYFDRCAGLCINNPKPTILAGTVLGVSVGILAVGGASILVVLISASYSTLVTAFALRILEGIQTSRCERALEKGEIAVAARLLDRGARLQTTTSSNEDEEVPVLIKRSWQKDHPKRAKALQMLLEKSRKDRDKKPSLLIGCLQNTDHPKRAEAVQMLLEKGADPSIEFRSSNALIYAIQYNQLDVVQCILNSEKGKACLNQHTKLEVPPLNFLKSLKLFEEQGDQLYKKFIIECASNPITNDKKSIEGIKREITALKKTIEESKNFLCRGGAAISGIPSTPGQEGMTPLMYAIAQNRPEIVKELLDQGADLDITCGKGYNAEDYIEAAPLKDQASLRRLIEDRRTVLDQVGQQEEAERLSQKSGRLREEAKRLRQESERLCQESERLRQEYKSGSIA